MKVLVFGASIVQGYNDNEGGGWVTRLASNNPDVFNLGISGDCTNRLLTRFDAEAKARIERYEGVVVFAIGINDTQRYEDGSVKTPIEEYQKNISALIENAKKYTDKIVVLGILPINETVVQPMPWASDRSHFEKDRRDYCAALEEVSGEHKVMYVPMEDVFGDDPAAFLEDGIHPTAAGHQLIAEKVKCSLEEAGLL